ncbi:MAG: hypothetical protein C0591_11145, partial [Marinilabiliales bacterium]
SQSVCLGTGVSFSVTATGEGALTYQWRKDGTNITVATNSTYNIASVSASDAGDYDCIVTGDCGSVTSSVATLTVEFNATAYAGADGEICEGNNYYVTGTTAANYTSILWTHNGLGTLQDPTTLSPVYVPGVGETGDVTLTLTVSGNCDPAVDEMIITILPNTTAYAGENATVCLGGSYTVMDAIATNYNTILWTHNGSGSLSNETTLSPNYTCGAGETGQVTLTLHADGDCLDATDALDITIIPNSSADAGTDASICESGSYTVNDATASDYNTLSWTHNGTGALSNATTLSPTYTSGAGETGIVTLTLTADGDCADDTDAMEITITPNSTAYAGSDASICENNSYTIPDANATNYTGILWTHNGSGTLSNATTLSPTYTSGSGETGTVTLTISITGACGDSMDDMDINIYANPLVDAGEDGIVCEDDNHLLNGFAENHSSILWSTSGDGTFDNPSILNALYTPGNNDINSGSVMLTLTAEGQGDCDAVSDDLLLEISYMPLVDAGENDTICHNESYVLSGYADNESNILWTSAGDGSFDDPTLLDATYTPGDNDIFMGGVELILHAYAISPCDGTSMDQMFLNIEICGFLLGLSYEHVNFRVAPNPANGTSHFFIENLYEEEVTIQIMDMKGSLISSDKYQLIKGKASGKMILIGLEEGVYNIRAKSKGYLKTLRLIVTK